MELPGAYVDREFFPFRFFLLLPLQLPGVEPGHLFGCLRQRAGNRLFQLPADRPHGQLGEQAAQGRQVSVVGLVEGVEVLVPPVPVHHQRGVPPLFQREQGQGSGHPPVAVLERVYLHEAVVQPGSRYDRMDIAHPLVPLDQAFYLPVHLLGRGEFQKDAVGEPYVVGQGLESSVMQLVADGPAQRVGGFVVGLGAGDQRMQLSYEKGGERAVLPHVFGDHVQPLHLGFEHGQHPGGHLSARPGDGFSGESFGYQRLGYTPVDLVQALEYPGFDGVLAQGAAAQGMAVGLVQGVRKALPGTMQGVHRGQIPPDGFLHGGVERLDGAPLSGGGHGLQGNTALRD